MIINASCESQKVTIQNQEKTEVVDCKIESEGERKSIGIMIVDESGARYIALLVDDIRELVEIASKALATIELVAQVAASQGVAPVTANPQIASDITTLKQQIAEFKFT